VNQVVTVMVAKYRMARHLVAGVREESKLKVSVLSISAAGLWFGALFLFYEGFHFLVNFGGRAGGEFNFGDLLMNRMLGILALAVFMLLVFSNVLVAFSTLYKSREVVYLLQGPISYEHFFYARFLESVAFSSWSLGFLGAPMMIAYGATTKASLPFYAASLLFFVPYILIPAALGCFITMVLVRVFPRLKVAMVVLLGMLAVGLFFLYVRHTLRGTRISEDTILPVFLDTSARMQSPFLPSYWAARGVLSAGHLELRESAFWFLTLLSTALMTVWACGKAAQALFYPGWSYLMGQDRQRFKPEGRGPLAWIERALQCLRQPARALTMKDIRLFWRDPTQWSQFVIFFGIMAIYIANLRNSSRYWEQEMWRSFIACLNVGALSLILATLTSRFVFPLVSLEGRRFWILGLAPLTFRHLVWQKFWLSVCTSSLFTVGLAVLSAFQLHLEPIYFFLTVYSVIITNFGLSGLAVGLGALYPNFNEDNPARIVSGMGGTLNLLVSVGYITLVVAAQTFILQWRVLEKFTRPEMFWWAMGGVIVFITGLSALSTLLPIRLGLRNLNAMEF
jgi:ABC-2 type transport system permease protein